MQLCSCIRGSSLCRHTRPQLHDWAHLGSSLCRSSAVQLHAGAQLHDWAHLQSSLCSCIQAPRLGPSQVLAVQLHTRPQLHDWAHLGSSLCSCIRGLSSTTGPISGPRCTAAYEASAPRLGPSRVLAVQLHTRPQLHDWAHLGSSLCCCIQGLSSMTGPISGPCCAAACGLHDWAHLRSLLCSCMRGLSTSTVLLNSHIFPS